MGNRFVLWEPRSTRRPYTKEAGKGPDGRKADTGRGRPEGRAGSGDGDSEPTATATARETGDRPGAKAAPEFVRYPLLWRLSSEGRAWLVISTSRSDLGGLAVLGPSLDFRRRNIGLPYDALGVVLTVPRRVSPSPLDRSRSTDSRPRVCLLVLAAICLSTHLLRSSPVKS